MAVGRSGVSNRPACVTLFKRAGDVWLECWTDFNAPNAVDPLWLSADVVTWRLATGERRTRGTDDPSGTTLERVGGVRYAAGSGHWAITRGGQIILDGTVIDTGRGSGLTLAGDWIGYLAAPDTDKPGQSYLITNRSPRGITSLAVTLQARPFTPVLFDSQRGLLLTYGGHGGRVWGWTTAGGSVDLTAVPWPTHDGAESGARVFDVAGDPWIATAFTRPDTGGVFVALRPWANHACLVMSCGNGLSAFDVAFDAERQRIQVAVRSESGEIPVTEVDPTDARSPVEPVLPDDPILPTFPTPIWAGFYFASGRYGDFQPNANCQILALSHYADSTGLLPTGSRDRFLEAVRSGPMLFGDMADLDLLATENLTGQLAGLVLGEHPSGGEISAAAATARTALNRYGLRNRPVIATVMPDQAFADGWILPDGVDVFAVEIYLDPPGTDVKADVAALTHARIRQALAAFVGYPVILIAQAYDRNGAWKFPAALSQILATCAADAAASVAAIRGIWFFAYARPGGVRTYPGLEAWTDAIVQKAGIPLPFHGGSMTDRLKPNDELTQGQSLVAPAGKYRLTVQDDGNAVLYRQADGTPIWATGTAGGADRAALTMQTDGNLVLYVGGVPRWASMTFVPGRTAVLTDAGELRVVAPEPDFVSIGGPDPNPLPDPGQNPGGVAGATGQTRLIGSRSVGDDEGPKLYVGLSRFAWLWFWKFDRDRVLRELDRDRALGYRAARVLAQVGDPKNPADFWAGRIVDPDWPDYQDLIAGLTGAAKERGHLIEWTLFGKGGPYDTAGRRPDLIRRAVPAIQANARGVLFGEIMNEPNVQNTISGDELKALAGLASGLAPSVPWATGAFWFAPEDGAADDPNRYDRALQRTQTNPDIEHLDRDMSKGEGKDRPWRQGWDHGLTGRRWADNEAVGAGSSVTSESRAAVLRSHRAVNFVCGAFLSNLHGKPGVRGDLGWDTEPAYLDAPKAIRFLPGNLADGQPHNANSKFPGRPFTLDDEFLRANTANTRGIVRCYSRAVDGVCYSIPFGPVSPFELKAERNLRVQCFQQDLNDLIWERDVAAGERLTFDGTQPDYLLISRPR